MDLLRKFGLVFACSTVALAALGRGHGLSQDDIKLLQDPGGWEYITVSDQDAGVQTQHVCFDGSPHPKQCSGRLLLNPDSTFTQQTRIHGESVDRHGTYKINDDQIAFFDEFGERDGPYQLQLNRETNMLVLSMPQVRLELELESQYKNDREQKKAPRR